MESVGFVLIFLTWRVFNAQCALIFIVHTQFSPSNSPCHPHHCYNQYVMLNQGMKKFAFVGGLVGDWNGIYKQNKQQLLLTATGGLLGWGNASGNFPSCMFNLSLICNHGNYIHELILQIDNYHYKSFLYQLLWMKMNMHASIVSILLVWYVHKSNLGNLLIFSNMKMDPYMHNRVSQLDLQNWIRVNQKD